jgi:formylmethanofuran dehydrogenase subunit E-like metal-binding protein
MNLFRGGKVRLVMCLRICFAGLLFLIFFTPHLVFADACRDATDSLRASFEVTQGRGGIWGYMEQNSSLRGDSMIGFQVDGKLQRIIVIFESQCVKSKRPSKKNYQKIENILGDARMIFNLRPGRDPVKKIMTKINGLNSNLNKLIKELEA